MNDGFERILARLDALDRDFQNTKEFPIEDAGLFSRRWSDLQERVSRRERGKEHG